MARPAARRKLAAPGALLRRAVASTCRCHVLRSPSRSAAVLADRWQLARLTEADGPHDGLLAGPEAFGATIFDRDIRHRTSSVFSRAAMALTREGFAGRRVAATHPRLGYNARVRDPVHRPSQRGFDRGNSRVSVFSPAISMSLPGWSVEKSGMDQSVLTQITLTLRRRLESRVGSDLC